MLTRKVYYSRKHAAGWPDDITRQHSSEFDPLVRLTSDVYTVGPPLTEEQYDHGLRALLGLNEREDDDVRESLPALRPPRRQGRQ